MRYARSTDVWRCDAVHEVGSRHTWVRVRLMVRARVKVRVRKISRGHLDIGRAMCGTMHVVQKRG